MYQIYKILPLITFFQISLFFQINAQTIEQNTISTQPQNNSQKLKVNNTINTELELNTSEEIVLARHSKSNILYINCQNLFQVYLPKSGDKYYIRSLDSADYNQIKIEKDISENNLFSLLPDASDNQIGKIEILKNDKSVKQYSFLVNKVPPVKIAEKNSSNTLEYFSKNGFNISEKNLKLELKAISSSPEFEIMYPNDNQYIIRKMDIILANGRRAAGSTFSSTNEEIDLCDVLRIMQKDTSKSNYRLIIDIKNVRRINYKGEYIDTELTSYIFSIPLYKD